MIRTNISFELFYSCSMYGNVHFNIQTQWLGLISLIKLATTILVYVISCGIIFKNANSFFSAQVQDANRKIIDMPCALIFQSASVTYKYCSSALNPFKAVLTTRPSLCSLSFFPYLSSAPTVFNSTLYNLSGSIVFHILRCQCSRCSPAVLLSLSVSFPYLSVGIPLIFICSTFHSCLCRVIV